MAYTVKRLTLQDLDPVMLRFMADSADHLNMIYGNIYNWHNFPVKYAVEKQVVLACFSGTNPVGFLLGSLQTSIFDYDTTILKQQVLFAKHPRASVALLRYFIDFGRLNANHVITQIGEHTNLKPESLEKLGFTKVDVVYRMEV